MCQLSVAERGKREVNKFLRINVKHNKIGRNTLILWFLITTRTD